MRIMLRFLLVIGALSIVAVAWLWNSSSAQDWLFQKAIAAQMQKPSAMQQFDGLKVFMCGTASPLPAEGRAQACVAVLAGDSLYIVDAGAGSANVAASARLPFDRLEGVLLTHFHSDHIAALPEFNLNSWVAGRPSPLVVFGPEGVGEVVAGLNDAYRQDRRYRVVHHGERLLPPELGVMEARRIDAGKIVETGGLTISSFVVDHSPVEPAVGYRFDYQGRSVVVSGDTVVTQTLVEAATGADLLLHDALSMPIVSSLEAAARGSRMEIILSDIQDYHARVTDLEDLVDRTGVRQLALYHLVPAPQNALMERVFSRGLPQGAVLTRDGMMFELAAHGESVVRVSQ